MNRYLAILGRKQELAYAELQTVLLRSSGKNFSSKRLGNLVFVETPGKLDAESLSGILGGTVKIAKLVEKATKQNLAQRLAAVLEKERSGKAKLVFGISFAGNPGKEDVVHISKKVKSLLKNAGLRSRYVLPARSSDLSSVQVEKHRLVELYVIWSDSQGEIGRTVSVQDFEGFSERDYGRPYANPKEGMLPPKVARQMINLAFTTTPRPGMWVLDPFCGTGTIAMEALTLGLNSANSDISEEKVSGTTRNLLWLARGKKLKGKWVTYHSDATKISKKVTQKIDAVVTEPYLGPSRPVKTRPENMIKGLNKLYLGAVKDWSRLLRRGKRVVMVLPEIRIGKFVKRADLVIDRCENLGYTLVAGPYEYERPKAKVRRHVIVLERK